MTIPDPANTRDPGPLMASAVRFLSETTVAAVNGAIL
jgi:hypothetical protein